MLRSINRWYNSHRVAGQHLWNIQAARRLARQNHVYPDDCTKGWSVWLLITLCIYMLTCELGRLSEGLVGTWIYHLPGTVNVGPHPLPAQGVMHGLFSIIATHGLTQANRALGWVIVATSFSFCRARHYKWQCVTLVYGVFGNFCSGAVVRRRVGKKHIH